jgi:hypothetical protein
MQYTHRSAPAISSLDEENESVRVIYPQFNAEAQFGEVRLAVEMEFVTLAEFKKAVKDYTIHVGRQIKWIKNDKIRARAKCVFEHCKWEIFCSRSTITNNFQINSYAQEHSRILRLIGSGLLRSWN